MASESSDFPMNSGHVHAANAEDHLNNGLLPSASEEHTKAADAYLSAANRSTEASAKRTLLMLHKEHAKAAQDLDRRITKLRDEGKDPSVPQKRDLPKKPSTPRRSAAGRVGASSLRPMGDSAHAPEGTVDESFMLLGAQRSDPGDAFNAWWNTVQTRFDQHSEAVAFASAPLAHDPAGTATPPQHRSSRRDGSLSSDTDLDEPMVSRFTKRFGLSSNKPTRRQQYPPLSAEQQKEVDDLAGDELSESFFVIPEPEPSPYDALKLENESLRRRLEQMEKILKVRNEQDLQLRDSVYQATREIATRAGMGASVTLPRIDASTPGPVPLPGYQTAREGQYARRVKELEGELTSVKAENEKHKEMIVKFRQQWAKLKENHRAKKEAQAKAKAASSEGIPEEPEQEDGAQ
ncbi:hypothetical protein CYLTODRAFT_431207 [Cylindrobasidium torrendii FP15055 ss-10]|uniref:Uncharacterized protein n=1 Tax=Cylindrobasidium torrendii FP15055 ss-10 TaxID=1314674 RepID=A0A0D7BDS3_9AGAR|nr:hypothetical protein CYLTODRAFT_431207 [Cylindrobasidium torrendii FP15055 ss-10]